MTAGRLLKLGATGQFPEGRLDPSDEGALTIAVAADHQEQVVRILFGKRIAWIGFPKEQAIQLANLICKRAEEL